MGQKGLKGLLWLPGMRGEETLWSNHSGNGRTDSRVCVCALTLHDRLSWKKYSLRVIFSFPTYSENSLFLPLHHRLLFHTFPCRSLSESKALWPVLPTAWLPSLSKSSEFGRESQVSLKRKNWGGRRTWHNAMLETRWNDSKCHALRIFNQWLE